MNKMSLDHIKGITTCIEDVELLSEKINSILYFFMEDELDYGIKDVSIISTLTDCVVVCKFNKISCKDRAWFKIRGV